MKNLLEFNMYKYTAIILTSVLTSFWFNNDFAHKKQTSYQIELQEQINHLNRKYDEQERFFLKNLAILADYEKQCGKLKIHYYSKE